MKKFIFTSIIAILFLSINPTTSFAKGGYTKTGKDLSGIVKSAIKKVPTVDMISGIEIPETGRITIDNVIEISDMKVFCVDQKIPEEMCKKAGMAFTLRQTYPIYINTDSKMGSKYDLYDSVYAQDSQIAYAISAILYHESFHARGEKKEAPAYREEFAFLKMLKDRGALNNAPWARDLLSNTQANLEYAEKNEVSAIKIAAK